MISNIILAIFILFFTGSNQVNIEFDENCIECLKGKEEEKEAEN